MKEIPKQLKDHEHAKDDVANELLDAARDSGLGRVELPTEGTEAYENLVQYCKDYAYEVELQVKGQGDISFSGRRRRALHNQICIMLFGTRHEDTAPEKVDQVQKFALMVAEKDHLIT